MNGIPLLLIGGKKESGKSTVAKLCEEKFGGVTVSFSAPMKRFCAALGMPLDNLWGSTAKRDEVIPTPEFFSKERPSLSVKFDGAYAFRLADGAYAFRLAYDGHLAPVFGPWEQSHVRSTMMAWLGAEWDYVNGYNGSPPHPFTCRHALQTLGTECGRSINPDCWGNFGVDAALKILSGEYGYEQQLMGLSRKHNSSSPRQPPRMVVIDDCRFPNELVIGKVKGAKSILVERPSTSASADSHASETSLDLIPGNWWDASVRNDASLTDLNHTVSHKLNALGFTSGLQNSI